MKKVSFRNHEDELLSGRLELPIDQFPRAYVLFAHCFTCSKNLSAVRNISKALTLNGFGVLRFDFTGLGDSEGEFADTNFSSNVEDLLAAAEFLSDQYESPKLIVGHSLGGAAAIFAADKIPSVEAIATIGAPASPEHVSHLFEGSLEEIRQNKSAKVNLGGRPFTIKSQFIEDLHRQDLPEVLKDINKSLLILHSPQDRTVGIENAAKIYKAAMHPKSFVSLDGADHLMSDKEDSLYVGDVIATWATRYISVPEEIDLKSKDSVLVRIGRDQYVTDVQSGPHRMKSDEPVSVGGKDFGPSPYDYLLASLGTCTAITLRMYADRKKWDLDEVYVHLNHSKIHKEDCEGCEDKNHKLDLIERKIELVGNLDEQQKARLLEISNRCPVHRTLHGEIKVKSSLV